MTKRDPENDYKRPFFCVKCHYAWWPDDAWADGDRCKCGFWSSTRCSGAGFVGGQGRSAAEVERTALGGLWIILFAALTTAALFIWKGCA